jgi:hypothetical protein
VSESALPPQHHYQTAREGGVNPAFPISHSRKPFLTGHRPVLTRGLGNFACFFLVVLGDRFSRERKIWCAGPL